MSQIMSVLGINAACGWCQIHNGWGTYTCRIKDINGELCFIFKKVWYPVAKYISENADVLVQENGHTFSMPFKEWISGR